MRSGGISDSTFHRIFVIILCALLFPSQSYAAEETSATANGPGAAKTDGDSADAAPEEAVADQVDDKKAEEPANPNPYAFTGEPDKAQLETAFNRGLEFVHRRQWSAAVLLFEAMLTSKNVRPWRDRCRMLKGKAHFHLEQYAEALALLKQARGGFRKELHDWFDWTIGEAAMQIGKYAEAQTAYRRILEISDNNKHARDSRFYFRSQVRNLDAYIAMGKAWPVLTDIKKILEDEKHVIAFSSGDYLERDDRIEHPNSGEFLWLKSRAYRLLKKYREEGAFLNEVMLNYPDINRYPELVERRHQMKKEGLLPDPSYNDSFGYMERLRAINAFEESLELSESTLRTWPEGGPEGKREKHIRLLFILGKNLFSTKDYIGALETFKYLCEQEDIKPDDMPLYLWWLARTYSRNNRLAEAVQTFTLLADEYPKFSYAANARYLAAWLAGQNGEYDKSIGMLDAFASEYRGPMLRQNARWFAAFYSYLAGDYEGALYRVQELLQIYRSSVDRFMYTYWMGRIYEKKGEIGKALSCFAYLAGETEYRYYRMAASYRLAGMSDKIAIGINLKNRESVEILTTPQAVNDPRIDSAANARFEKWLAYEIEHVEMPDFSQDDFRDSLVDSERRMLNAADTETAKTMKFMQAQVDASDDLFPNLNKALIWSRLSGDEEAGRELEAFLEMLRKLKKMKKVRDEDEPEADFEIRKQRMEWIEKLDKDKRKRREFFSHVVKFFLQNGDVAQGFVVRIQNAVYDFWPGWNMEEQNMRHFPPAYADLVIKTSRDMGGDEDLILSIMRTESAFRHDVISPMGAIGLMQIMPFTGFYIARDIQDDDYYRARLFEPDVTIRYGGWYLGQLVKRTRGQLPLAIASYNGGIHNVSIWLERWERRPLEWDELIENFEFDETRNYVRKVLRCMAAYRQIYSGSFHAWDMNRPVDYEIEEDGVNY